MRKAVYSLIFVIVATFQVPLVVLGNEKPSDELINAATEGIKAFLKDVPPQHLHRFGFQSKEEVDTAVLGQEFRIYTIPPDTILQNNLTGDVSSLAIPTNKWEFLILNGEKTAARVSVDLVDGKWTAVSVGASILADQLEKIILAWPSSADYNYRIIRINQISSDFVEISQKGRIIGICPLVSARLAMGFSAIFNPIELYDGRAFINKIQRAVRRNVQIENIY